MSVVFWGQHVTLHQTRHKTGAGLDTWAIWPSITFQENLGKWGLFVLRMKGATTDARALAIAIEIMPCEDFTSKPLASRRRSDVYVAGLFRLIARRILATVLVLMAFVLPFVPRGVRWYGGSFAVWHELYDLRWYVSPTTGGVVWSSVDLGYSVSYSILILFPYNILILIPLIPFILGLALALFLLRAFRRNTLTKFRTFLVGTIILAVFFLKANLYLLLLPAGAQAMLMRETAPYTLMIGVLETGRGVANPSTFVVLALGVLLALNVLWRKPIPITQKEPASLETLRKHTKGQRIGEIVGDPK